MKELLSIFLAFVYLGVCFLVSHIFTAASIGVIKMFLDLKARLNEEKRDA